MRFTVRYNIAERDFGVTVNSFTRNLIRKSRVRIVAKEGNINYIITEEASRMMNLLVT